jgi:hypothetical protein
MDSQSGQPLVGAGNTFQWRSTKFWESSCTHSALNQKSNPSRSPKQVKIATEWVSVANLNNERWQASGQARLPYHPGSQNDIAAQR